MLVVAHLCPPSVLEGTDSAAGVHRDLCTEWLVQSPCIVHLDFPLSPQSFSNTLQRTPLVSELELCWPIW